jgi:4,5-dihydroxyphthalate decarboxylase
VERPGLAKGIFDAFVEAKRLYVEDLKAGRIATPTPVDEVYKRVMDITGRDPLPYGIEPNRAMIQEVIDSALEQKVLTVPVTIEELFPASTHSLAG